MCFAAVVLREKKLNQFVNFRKTILVTKTNKQIELNKTKLGGGGNNKRGKKIGHYKKYVIIEELTKLERNTHNQEFAERSKLINLVFFLREKVCVCVQTCGFTKYQIF